MPATPQQVQAYADSRIRPRCEQIRALLLALEDDLATITEIRDSANDPTFIWTDSRGDSPPRYLVKSDVSGYANFAQQLVAILRGTLANDVQRVAAANMIASAMPIVLRSCVRGVG